MDLDAPAQNYIGTLIGMSVERMEREGALTSPDKVDAAEKAFQTLVRASVGRARRSQGIERRSGEYARESAGVIHEAALLDALKGLCPIWPIC